MILRSNIFRRATIVGVGLIGGSLGLAMKKFGLAKEVIGLSHRQSSLVQAINVKAIDAGYVDVKQAIRNADLVVLATPVSSIIKLLTTINPYLKRGCIVTDVGSSKAEIVDVSESVLTNPGLFIGGHPLSGSEKKGIEFASDSLFEGGSCILTPTNKTNQVAKEKVKYLWTKIGCKVSLLTPEEHDDALAYVSHLPHLLAFGLMESVPEKYLEYSTQGIKDLTRIAASPPKMWNDILLSNKKNVVKSLDEFVGRLAIFRKALIDRDQKTLNFHFTKAKEKRDGIDKEGA